MVDKTQPRLERTYTIPLRREILKVPRYKRAKKAVTAVKQFLSKHMKSEDVRIGSQLNEELWKHGIKNPPTKIRVIAIREKNIIRAEKEGATFKSLEAKKKSEVATGLKGKLQSMVQSTKEDKGKSIEELTGDIEEKVSTEVNLEQKEENSEVEKANSEEQKEKVKEESNPKVKKESEVKEEAKEN